MTKHEHAPEVVEMGWRCFHCDEIFTSPVCAAKHFGTYDLSVPACKIKAHEGHLVTYIRRLEHDLERCRSEDSDVMRSIMTLETDHRTALRRAEEEGYDRGLNDGRALNASGHQELVDALELAAHIFSDMASHGYIGPKDEPGCYYVGEAVLPAINEALAKAKGVS